MATAANPNRLVKKVSKVHSTKSLLNVAERDKDETTKKASKLTSQHTTSVSPPVTRGHKRHASLNQNTSPSKLSLADDKKEKPADLSDKANPFVTTSPTRAKVRRSAVLPSQSVAEIEEEKIKRGNSTMTSQQELINESNLTESIEIVKKTTPANDSATIGIDITEIERQFSKRFENEIKHLQERNEELAKARDSYVAEIAEYKTKLRDKEEQYKVKIAEIQTLFETQSSHSKTLAEFNEEKQKELDSLNMAVSKMREMNEKRISEQAKMLESEIQMRKEAQTHFTSLEEEFKRVTESTKMLEEDVFEKTKEIRELKNIIEQNRRLQVEKETNMNEFHRTETKNLNDRINFLQEENAKLLQNNKLYEEKLTQAENGLLSRLNDSMSAMKTSMHMLCDDVSRLHIAPPQPPQITISSDTRSKSANSDMLKQLLELEACLADSRARMAKTQEERRIIEMDKLWQRHTIESLISQLDALKTNNAATIPLIQEIESLKEKLFYSNAMFVRFTQANDSVEKLKTHDFDVNQLYALAREKHIVPDDFTSFIMRAAYGEVLK